MTGVVDFRSRSTALVDKTPSARDVCFRICPKSSVSIRFRPRYLKIFGAPAAPELAASAKSYILWGQRPATDVLSTVV